MNTCVGLSGPINSKLKFTEVKTANGIHNTDLIRNSGIFTCENPGLYLISVFIETHTNHSLFYVYKNKSVIAYGYSSLTDWFQTTLLTAIEKLSVNDTISVMGSLNASASHEACLTILQIQ